MSKNKPQQAARLDRDNSPASHERKPESDRTDKPARSDVERYRYGLWNSEAVIHIDVDGDRWELIVPVRDLRRFFTEDLERELADTAQQWAELDFAHAVSNATA